MKNLVFIFAILFALGLQAQSHDESKPTVIVPIKFDFMKEKNQYQLNILARVLLKEAGFNVYMDVEDKPLKIQSNPCSNLRFELEEVDSFLRKRLFFTLVDCSNNAVYTSEVGQSSSKAFKPAYEEALRGAFQGFSSKDIKFSNNYQLVKSTDQAKSSDLENGLESQPKSVFKFAGQKYWLVEKTDSTYILYLASTQNRFAELEAADKGSYIYKSGDLLGAAYFTASGHLEVEYKDEDTQEIQTLRFTKVE